MATTFEGNLPTDEILQGATAVALGRLIEVVESAEDPDAPQRPLLTYRVQVDDVLAGTLEPEILLRLVNRDYDPDQQRLLVLTPDFGVARDNQYVPYFSQPSAAEDGRYVIGDEDYRGLDEIRERLSTITARRRDDARALAEEERGQDLDAPYPDVTEAGEGRGDTVVDAQIAEPLGRTDGDDGKAD